LKQIVIDASVAAKWVLPEIEEGLVPQAVRLLDLAAKSRVDFIAPELFWAEIGSVFSKAVRRGRWREQDAIESTAKLQSFAISTASNLPLLAAALKIALDHNQSVYDAIYVSLAMERRSELVTADERLVNALGARFPVRWLGSFSIT